MTKQSAGPELKVSDNTENNSTSIDENQRASAHFFGPMFAETFEGPYDTGKRKVKLRDRLTERVPPKTTKINRIKLRQQAIDCQAAGKLEEATKLYQRYLTVAPKDADIWNNMGALLRRQAHFSSAIGCYKNPCLFNHRCRAF